MFQYSCIVRAPLFEWSNLLQLLLSFSIISSFSRSLEFILDTIWRAAGTPSKEPEPSMVRNQYFEVTLAQSCSATQKYCSPQLVKYQSSRGVKRAVLPGMKAVGHTTRPLVKAFCSVTKDLGTKINGKRALKNATFVQGADITSNGQSANETGLVT